MSYFWLPIGLALPTLIGWLLLRIVEGSTPVLDRIERWIAGFVLGPIFVTFIIFLTEITGIGNLSFLSMLITHIVLLCSLFIVHWKFTRPITIHYLLPTTNSAQWQPWQKVTALILGIWFVLKLVAGWIILIGPAYFDDTIKNWNLRAKAFTLNKELVLEAISGLDRGIGSYPPSIPLIKTWLVSLNGGWHEGLANGIHLLWYIAAIALVFYMLRRTLSVWWSLVGAYILSALPLYLMHGSVAYADLCLSLVILLAVGWMWLGYFRLSAVATGLLVFTKNEALMLHVPPIVVLALGIAIVRKNWMMILWYASSLAAVAGPWLLFKWSNDLVFGNAKAVPTEFTWHSGVLNAIFRNTFFEGNWNILPGIFLVLIALHAKRILRSSLLIPLGFVLMVILGQLPLYMFTYLSVEAINQTGYARGIIHVMPLIVIITTVLLQRSLNHHRS